MTKEQEIRKLVEEWVSSDLGLAGIVSAALYCSLQAYARRAKDSAVEWETVAVTALETRLFNGQENTLANRIERQQESSAFDWSSIITKLRKKHAAKAAKREVSND